MEDNKQIYIGLNQDQSCIISVFENGFKIYNLSNSSVSTDGNNSIKEIFAHKFEGTIKHVEMLYKTNIYAIIGGGEKPIYSPNKLIIWDILTKKPPAELTYRKPVIGVKWKRDKLLVILSDIIYVYNLTNLKLICQVEIPVVEEENYKNTILLTPHPDKNLVILPSTIIGCVNICNINDSNFTPCHIPAHQSELSYITHNQDCNLIATSSIKGTIIRVFDIINNKLIHEFRRGIDTAKINNMSFDPQSKYLVVSSNKGTIHIYSLENANENTVSLFSSISGILPQYFSSKWSYKQIKIPKLSEIEFKIVVTNDIITILTYLGNVYTINIKDLYQDTVPITEDIYFANKKL
jgi:WD40 repeat protein